MYLGDGEPTRGDGKTYLGMETDGMETCLGVENLLGGIENLLGGWGHYRSYRNWGT